MLAYPLHFLNIKNYTPTPFTAYYLTKRSGDTRAPGIVPISVKKGVMFGGLLLGSP